MVDFIQKININIHLICLELGISKILSNFFNNHIWLNIRLLFNESYEEQFATLARVKNCNAILEQTIGFYQHTQSILSASSIDLGQILAIYQNSEKCLGALYHTRCKLLDDINLTLFGVKEIITANGIPFTCEIIELTTELQSLQLLIERCDDSLTGIIKLLNRDNFITDTKKEAYEKMLQEWQNRSQQLLRPLINYKPLQDVMLYKLSQLVGAEFPAVYQQAATHVLLQHWLLYIRRAHIHLINQEQPFFSARELARVLGIKYLLINTKTQEQLSRYHNISLSTSGKLWLVTIKYFSTRTKKPLSDFVQEELQMENLALRRDIRQIEGILKNYSWSIASFASVIRLWSESYYFKMADQYFTWLNELSPNFLTPNYTSFFKIVGSLSLVGFHNLLQRWLTNSAAHGYGGLSVLYQLFTPQLESIISLIEDLGMAEKTALDLAPSLKRIAGFIMFAGVNLCTLGFSGTSLSFIALNYITLNLTQEIINAISLGTIGSISPAKTFADFWNCIVHPFFLTVGGQLLHDRYIAPLNFQAAHLLFYIPQPSTISIDESSILDNSELCLQHRKLCEDIIFKILKLHSNASKSEIRTTFRSLFLELHADRRSATNAAADARLFTIRRTKALLRELTTTVEFASASTLPSTKLAIAQ